MLQPEMRHVVAQRKQKMVIAIMPRAKKRLRLGHQTVQLQLRLRQSSPTPPRCPPRCRSHAMASAPASVESPGNSGPKITGESTSVVSATGANSIVVAILLHDRQRRAEFPIRRQPQARRKIDILRRKSLRVQQHLIPAQHVQRSRRRSPGRKSRRQPPTAENQNPPRALSLPPAHRDESKTFPPNPAATESFCPPPRISFPPSG